MKIFFSYAREDAAFALKLASALRKAGAELWIDQLDIRPGEHWDNAVEAALKECPAFLVILSSRSVSSHNVLDEVHYAIEEAKKILPIMYETCKLPFRLRRLQYIDFTEHYEDALKACVAHVRMLFGQTASATLPRTTKLDGLSDELNKLDQVIRTQSSERLSGKRFLWVDDQPSNNRYERKALEELGAEIHLAIDTKDAMLIAREMAFHLVISDIARPSSGRAGYTLLANLRKANLDIPVVFYTGSNAERDRKEAIRAGAVGCTNSPYDLLEMIVTALAKPNR